MSKRTVLRVDTSCAKCKRKVLLAVSGLQGVDKIEVDSEKGTMTVTGGVDPVHVVEATRRKAGKRADVLTIGPPPPPASKPEEKKKPEQHWEPEKRHAAAERSAPEPPVTVYVHHVPVPPPSWPAYEQCAVVPYHYQQQDPCSIM
ncbi:heavy metal-associated isoprenylated plant protein 2-like [Hordeum vulgare subsp. vulgare]|uniref:Predicted protein n=1 Tax=Hordeum vulgare subsp. vulgare TaxID=112509 RepID=F2DGW6_HORVV|nr:heavy metal-associated isoprenylated plant protein 2-like [Hordeum vulgare subsp. vulgare]KAI4965591.1 hypothetical protein ZWY2020_051298 [Hordeum vulgare]KAI5010503.1 hypothetical protein ZWY2020_012640 [Hordeum vulgare]BAJ94337.1 predicted protein [Hordeum vulgare subsp. vulgare]